MPELLNKINSDLMAAMKSKDEFKLSVLRMMKSKILYVNARGDLTDAEIIKIISKYSKELTEAAEEAKKVGRPEAAKKSEDELKVVMQYLPKQLSVDETKKAVEDIVKELGATTIKDMGNVMKAVSANHPGIDNKLASQIVREILK